MHENFQRASKPYPNEVDGRHAPDAVSHKGIEQALALRCFIVGTKLAI
jgi:hypothetical protein